MGRRGRGGGRVKEREGGERRERGERGEGKGTEGKKEEVCREVESGDSNEIHDLDVAQQTT